MSTTMASQKQESDVDRLTAIPSVVYPARIPKSFHGDVFEDVDDWLDHFDRVAAANEWDERRKLRYIYFALEDYARTWYENHESYLNTWQEFERQLREAFRNMVLPTDQ